MVDALFEAIERAGIEAAIGAMGRGAVTAAARAKDLAPVRKVFKGQNDTYRTRLKTISEIAQDRGIRSRLGLGPESEWINPPSIVSRRAPQLLSIRRVVNGQMRSQDRLDRRGRWELASGRAITDKGNLGGRLRDEIFATEATMEGGMIKAEVVSPTPYAPFQEFGTRHNPAHPYLRPAGYESKGAVAADVRNSVSAAASEAARGGVVVKVIWHLKARR